MSLGVVEKGGQDAPEWFTTFSIHIKNSFRFLPEAGDQDTLYYPPIESENLNLTL